MTYGCQATTFRSLLRPIEMKTIELGNIDIQIDLENTKDFYSKQLGFTCDCPDCINYVEQISIVKNLMNGLDEKLGIDLSKDVGQGMDELHPHDNEDHCMYLIPYYIKANCLVNGKELISQPNGPIWETTVRAEYRLSDNLNLLIINTSEYIEFDNAESVLTVWLEFKTPLFKKESELKGSALWRGIKWLFLP